MGGDEFGGRRAWHPGAVEVDELAGGLVGLSPQQMREATASGGDVGSRVGEGLDGIGAGEVGVAVVRSVSQASVAGGEVVWLKVER